MVGWARWGKRVSGRLVRHRDARVILSPGLDSAKRLLTAPVDRAGPIARAPARLCDRSRRAGADDQGDETPDSGLIRTGGLGVEVEVEDEEVAPRQRVRQGDLERDGPGVGPGDLASVEPGGDEAGDLPQAEGER